MLIDAIKDHCNDDTVTNGGRSTPARGHRLRRGFSLAVFRRDEDGALVIFSVFMLLMILFVGSLGVDMMRFEMERSKLQSTLDRAVLAAADIDQTMDPATVVNEYFTKSGLGGSVTGVTVTESLGYRSVSATARKTINTQLIHMLGVDTMSAPAAGAAEERVDAVEISMVLDVSGSMASNNKIGNLRTAGGQFIDAIYANTEPDKVSISIVPYNGQVNVGPDLIDQPAQQHVLRGPACVGLYLGRAVAQLADAAACAGGYLQQLEHQLELQHLQHDPLEREPLV